MSILDYFPLTGMYREATGAADDGEYAADPPHTAEEAEDYVPQYMSGIGCNACGYDDIGVGESCPLCGIGHGIDAG